MKKSEEILKTGQEDLNHSTLTESEERFNMIFENSPIGISMTGVDGSLRVNKVFCDTLGYSEKKLKEKKWTEITHPDDIKESQDIVNDLLSGKTKSARYEKRYLHKSGKIVWADVSTTLQRDKADKPLFFITTINDITQLKESEFILQEEKERIRSIIDLVGEPIFVKDNDHRITLANQAFYDMFGMDEKSVIGYTLVEAVPENERQQFLEVDRAVLDTGKPDTREEELTVNNFTRAIVTRKASFTDKTGNKFLVGSIYDITDRVQAEEEVKKANERLEAKVIERTKELSLSEEKFRTVADFTYDWETWTSPEGIPLYVSPSCERITGYTSSEFINDPSLLMKITDSLDKKHIEKHFSKKEQKNKSDCIVEFRIQCKDGTLKWIGHVCQPVTTDDGRFLGRRGSNRDITMAKKNEEELTKSKKLLEETGRLASVGGWEIDLIANTLYWSETTLKIHEVEPGFVPDVATGINFYAPEAIPVISKCVENAISKGEPFDVELQLITAKNNRLWVRAIGEANKENGKVIKVGGVFQDINARKIIEQELEDHRAHLEQLVSERTRDLDIAIANLERSNQELEQFAYVASHDLQEPLRMVSSYTQLLERRYKDQLDQDAKDFINYAVDGANRMQRLINDLLDFSRVTTKGKPIVKLDLAAVLGQAISNLHNRIQETGSMIVNDNLPFAYGDESQLVRVFQNLLDNAMKFTGSESPRINVTTKTIDDKVQISISDNGIGIDKIYTERVFTIFQRLHTKADYPGTGIGLAICKRTIERHGGKIWFESEPEKGTTFHFTLNTK